MNVVLVCVWHEGNILLNLDSQANTGLKVFFKASFKYRIKIFASHFKRLHSICHVCQNLRAISFKYLIKGG